MLIGIAIVVALLYWIANLEMSSISMTFQSPIIIGAIIGVLYGDATQGVIIGAGLQAMYMGVFTAGNVLPSDKALASCVAIPIALASGLDATAAIALAVPFGVLGAFIDVLRKTINSYWVRRADRYIEDANLGGIRFCAIFGPILTQFVVRFIPVLFITYFGASLVTPLLDYIPEWVMNGLSVAGGILPAVGFVTCVLTIGRKNLIPFFLIGFFLMKITGMPIIASAIFAAAAAMLYVNLSPETNSAAE